MTSGLLKVRMPIPSSFSYRTVSNSTLATSCSRARTYQSPSAKYMPADLDTLHFRCAFTDPERSRVAVDPLDRQIAHIASGTEHDDRRIGDAAKHLGREQLCPRRSDPKARPTGLAIECPGKHEHASGLDVDIHVGQLELDCLMLTKRAPE